MLKSRPTDGNNMMLVVTKNCAINVLKVPALVVDDIKSYLFGVMQNLNTDENLSNVFQK